MTHAVNALLRDPYQNNKKNVPIADRSDAENYLLEMVAHGLIVKVNKESGSKVLTFEKHDHSHSHGGCDHPASFSPDDYYIWRYQGSQLTGMLMAIGVLALVFIGVLFPLWPAFMRQGVYYLSLAAIGFLGFLMVLGVIRGILWIILVATIGQGGWLFPNLFADVGFFESFVPLWT
ncbi:Translocation protein S62 [Globomyces sp. JEL0801]|nr:Translocation protein S62 [Globomyces sp. JEL0801]